MSSAILPKSSAARLAWFYGLLFWFSVAGLGLLTVVLIDATLRRQIDQRLRLETAAVLAAGAVPNGLSQHSEKAFRYRLQSAAGSLIAGDLPELGSQVGLFSFSLPESIQLEAPDSFRGLASVMGENTVIVALDLDELENTRSVLLGAYGVTALLSTLLASLGGKWLARVFFGRLQALAGTAVAITAGDLSLRMAVDGRADEIDQLSLSLNRMLDRNAELLESQRQITNDIAHDIRTPLTRLRQKIEQGHGKAALVETDEIIETLNALLRIAEIEEGARRKCFVSVDLGQLAQHVGEAYAAAFEEQGMHLDVKVERSVRISGDKQLLSQMLSNLMENVLVHTPRGSNAVMSVSHHAGGFCLRLRDNGPGVPNSEAVKIQQRFYRLESSRNAPGSGLGLSLVKAIAALHGAELEINVLDPGLEVVVGTQKRDGARLA